jgi:CheY-like chemotaxis protein
MTTVRNILLVEDEAMIRMMLVDMLTELGYHVAAETGDIDEAMSLAKSVDFDLAILDVNLNGKFILPLAKLLEKLNRRFIFATGYGPDGLPDQYRDRPCLQKPFQLDTLGNLLSSIADDPPRLP